MTVVVWPDDLPEYALVEGFHSGPRGARLKTAMDVGPGKQRRRGPALKPVAYSFIAEADQLARFYRFWEEDTKGGTLPFLVTDKQFDGALLATEDGAVLLTEDGAPILLASWWFVTFGQAEPSDVPMDSFTWRVSFELIVLP